MNHTSHRCLFPISFWYFICYYFSYANVKKCSNEGRALMQLDFQQFLMKLEKLTDIRPIPDKEFVETYIKAYYLTENDMERWIKEHRVRAEFWYSIYLLFIKIFFSLWYHMNNNTVQLHVISLYVVSAYIKAVHSAQVDCWTGINHFFYLGGQFLEWTMWGIPGY